LPLPTQFPELSQASVVVQNLPSLHAVPAVSGAHVPLVPPVFAALQPWHGAVQAVSQQTPSTQRPLAHSPSPVHGPPWATAQTPVT